MSESFDVVVIGSGAAGLTAALTAAEAGASVLVLEASDRWGGSTAVSGGLVWAPDHHHAAEKQLVDSRDDALAYLRSCAYAREDDRVVAFVDAVPQAVRFVEEHTPLTFQAIDYPDTFAERPGGKLHRHLESLPQDPGALGRWQDLFWTQDEPHTLMSEILPIGAHVYGLPLDLPAVTERRERGLVTGGAALVTGLLHGIDAAGVTRRPDSRVTALTTDAGRVTGVTLADGSTVGARRGVVLASGGFEWNDDLKSAHLSVPITHQVTPPVQHGDALGLASAAGAALAHTHENWAWPAVEVPMDLWPDGSPRHHLSFSERYMPHCLWVNGAGRRFVNESSHNVALALGEVDPTGHRPRNLPAWSVMDARFRARYQVAGVLPGEDASEWIVEAPTLAGLAALIGVDAGALAETVDRFNTFAADGVDPDFGRGLSAYERAMGDPTATYPNLGTVAEGPFTAVAIRPSTVGTKGGVLTDARAAAVRYDGTPVPGLFAAGNAMAAVFGPGISGGGMTIGNAIAWGWLAGRGAAGGAA
ncbi:FAD-dependent oxidoreductase [Nocardioides marmoriginsengisoli]|uniref:FAD-dependent oxidoreductase n=1 Tax=Nocardioides marmoriginsengisoli TaxID=661483 RepID=UPI00161F3516|nr:FAD-dependent oxidoreductase [Nocardioides marmoriginsengisoli]